MLILFAKLKNIVLFPIRMTLAMLFFLWSLASGNIYSPGCAPIFYKERYILYLKRKGFNRYGVVLYDLFTHSGELIFQSNLHISRYRLINNELICSYLINGEINYVIIALENRSIRYTTSYATVNSTCYDLLTKIVGAVLVHKVCAKEMCYQQILIITDTCVDILENLTDDIIFLPTISNDDRYISYSTLNGIYISDVLNKKQNFYAEGESFVFNWDKGENLLAYCKKSCCFFLLNPTIKERKQIKLPNEFANIKSYIMTAALSPNGTFIAYGVKGCAENILLVLQTVQTGEYKILTQKACILGIGWSANEKYISISGVNKRDLLEISYGFKMKNAMNHDKEVIDIDGNVIMRS